MPMFTPIFPRVNMIEVLNSMHGGAFGIAIYADGFFAVGLQPRRNGG